MKLSQLFTATLTAALFVSQTAAAISIDWTGGYRVEYTSVSRPSLASDKLSKDYALNFLYLQPRIIGSDGVNIVSRFDIMGSQIPAYKNSQLGSVIGGGLNDGTGATGTNATSQNQNSSSLQVSQLYLNVNHEYGSLLVGRTPIEFGLGITHNAGKGQFDHWMDTKEVISYRFVVDNLSIAPMVARVSQADFGGGVANDQIYIVEYNNKEAGARAGLFHQTRTAGPAYNDYSVGELPSGVTSATAGLKTQTVNIFLERKWQPFEFKIEASFLTGNTGVQNASGQEIKVDSYAVVMEGLFPAGESSWEYSGKAGVVSGDNKDTTDTYEGYILDRNYDLGFLLFNHRLGSADIIGSSPLHANDTLGANKLSTQNSADDEAVTNAMFFAPTVKYAYDDQVDLKGTIVYAQLMNAKKFVDMKKDLGLELDVELVYKPRERVTWSTGFGMLMPGAAWEGGSTNNFDSKTTYGLTTRAAITF
ncbi:hypothetical protein CIK05_13780 [Bdellovibrio sp. qaytius]|nr:hypothetical protein CIK05_13780 [Bdellovibrio sp. qaytius]